MTPISDDMVKEAAIEFLYHRGEHPRATNRGGLALWETYAPAMRAALTSALEGSVAVPAEVREIVELYFAPWGAAKGARWEALSGDQPFNAEIAMSLIEAAMTRKDGKVE